ncbi:MAG TPA: polysaccharide biosynthesis tyrosine autokinase [Actinomycetota bacterium]|nr:polysaccharide biosynthesis tyrosine autokinase [Actinomycetota bacterium]
MDDAGAQLLRKYLRILKRRWLIIAGLVVAGAVSAAVVSVRMAPTYQATAEVNVTPFVNPSSPNSDVLNFLANPTVAMQTDVTLIQSDAVLTLAQKNLPPGAAGAQRSTVKASVVPGTQIIQVQAANHHPALAAAWADAVANAFISFQRDAVINDIAAASKDLTTQIDSLKAQIAAAGASPASATAVTSMNDTLTTLQGQLDQLPGANSIVSGGGSVVQSAATPRFPVSPKGKQNVLLGAALGLLLAVGLALLIEALDDRLRSAEDVEAVTGSLILGSVPHTKELETPAGSAALVHNPASPTAEAYRSLRTNLRFLSVDRPLGTLLVTSSVKGEGKSTTAANIAAAFAVSGVRTVLVSADLRRPSVHRFFGLQNSLGLVDAVLPNVPLERLMQTNELPHLRVLAAGRTPPNPAEILASARFGEILEVLRSAADLVIIDSPPLLGVADAGALASRVDGVVLVVNPGEVTHRTLTHAQAQLQKAGGQLLGVVINGVGSSRGFDYDTGYYGYDYYSYTAEEPRGARRRRERSERATNRPVGGKLPQPSVSTHARSADYPWQQGAAGDGWFPDQPVREPAPRRRPAHDDH